MFNRVHTRSLSYLALGLVPFGVYIAPQIAASPVFGETANNILLTLPLLAFAALGFLGWKLNQTRIFVASLVLLGLFYLLRHPDTLTEYGVGKIRLPQILSVSLPFSFALIFLIKESRLWSRPALYQLLLGLLPPVFFIFYLMIMPESFNTLFQLHVLEFPINTKLPQVAIFPLMGLGLVVWISKDRKVKPFLSALLWSMLPLLAAFHITLNAKTEVEEALFYQNLALLSVSLILLHTIFSMYWHRVYIDELTGIPNRRALDERLYNLRDNYALAMIDIDHFKKFNDSYGHDEGDNVLRLVGAHMEAETGRRAYRYGGEEFCAVFENVNQDQAAAVMDRCRLLLQKRTFHVRTTTARKRKGTKKSRGTGGGGKKVQVTVSVGIAVPTSKATTPVEVLKLSDKALYKAKENGRNRVETND